MVTVPARPSRSRARRISGAKMTGMASSNAGRILWISQEKAGSSTRVVSKHKRNDEEDHASQKDHRLGIAQGIKQCKEDQRYQQNVENA